MENNSTVMKNSNSSKASCDKGGGHSSPAAIEAGCFTVRSAAQWCREASLRPDPRPLWWSLWHENEVACLFADTNMGKSIYAVQIADYVARHKGLKVAYFDFEMSDKQFQTRYTDPSTGALRDFHPDFLRVELSAEAAMVESVPLIMQHISRVVEATGAQAVIIDNISWICNRSEQGDAAGELMQELISLKRRKGLSVLVLAHTPKRSESSPLTQNSLAGSKRIANFMDSMFAIGKSTHSPGGRYIKQIKVRSSELEYGEESVITARLEKQGADLGFVHESFAPEAGLLPREDKGGGSEDEKALAEAVRTLRAQGLSQSQIAAQLHKAKSTVNRICRELDAE